MSSLDELRAKLRIDKFNLDDELVEQAVYLETVGDAYTEAADERDYLKERLADVAAEVELEVRRKLDTSGRKRITDAEVKAMVQLDKRRQEAFDKYLEAKKKADKLGVLKQSFTDRSFAVRELCGLYTARYYERDSVKSTGRTDKAGYEQRRERLASAREARDSGE